MAGGEGGAPPPERALSKNRCPSCGGLLTFEPGRPGGFCAIEAIFVQVVAPVLPEADRPLLVRDAVLRATKKQLHDLCSAYGLRVSGNKTDLLTRILRYMDENRIDLPPEERDEAAIPEQVPEVLHPEAPAPPATDARPSTETPDETLHEPAVAAVTAEVEHLLQETERAAAAPVGAIGEAEPEPARAWREESRAAGPRVNPARLRKDRRTFYAGSVLTIAGGGVLFLGSVLHDVLRVPFVGTSYEAFGPLNVTAAIAGFIVLLVGLGAIKRSLRGGVVRAESVAV